MKRAFVVSLAVAIVVAGAASKVHKRSNSNLITGTILLSGQLASANTLTMKGTLNTGDATNVDWQLPIAQTETLNGYAQQVSPPSFQWSTAPDSSSDTTSDGGIPVRDFHWNKPPSGQPIAVTETLHLATASNLSAFQSSASYPMSSLTPELQKYAAVTPELQLPGSADGLVQQLKAHASTEQQVVSNVADWVAANIHYNPQRINGPFDAAWVLQHREAACRGFDDIMAALLARMGIPSRSVWGWVGAGKLSLPGPGHAKASVQWSVPGSQGELHTWLNIWFPDQGWVPFDPQEEKFFVDPRHMAFWSTRDAGQNPDIGIVFADFTGSTQSIKADIVPGAGLGPVTVRTQDGAMSVAFRNTNKNPQSLVMFAR